MAEGGENNRNSRRIVPTAAVCLALTVGGVVFTATGMAQTDFDPSSYLAKNYQAYASEQLQSIFDSTQSETDSEANKHESNSESNDESLSQEQSQVELDTGDSSTVYSITGDEAAVTVITTGTNTGTGTTANTASTADKTITVNGPIVNTGDSGNGTGGNTTNTDPEPDPATPDPTPSQPAYTDTYGDLDDDSTTHYDADGNEVLSITVSGSIGDKGTVLLGANTSDASLFSNITVTAQKRSADGTEFSESISFGDYTVQANTARTGNYSALFEYCGVSDSLNYTVTQLYNALRVSVYTNNRYYVTSPYISSSGYPIGSKGYVYASSGSSIVDMSSIFRQILAWYDADTPGLDTDTYKRYINHEKTTLKPDENGYLVNMAVGFGSKWDGANDVWAPYSLIADLNNDSVKQYLKVGPVPNGALLRLESSEEGGAQMGDQVFVGCTSTDGGSFAVPYGTTKIALDRDCNDLASLTIPGSVMSIDAASLNKHAVNLTSFSVDSDNANFSSSESVSSSESGLLMDKAGTTVLAVPAGASAVALPEGTTLSADALSGRTNSLTITLTDTEPSDALLQGILDAAAQMDSGATLTIAVPNSTDNVSYVHYLAAWGKSLADTGITLTVNGNETVPGLYTLSDDGSVVSSKDAGYLACVPWDAETYKATGITTIGSSALGTGSLAALTLDAATPPTLGSNVFGKSYTDTLVFVPENALSSYKEKWATQLDGEYGEGTADTALQAQSGLVYKDGAYYLQNDDGSLELRQVTARASANFTVAEGTTSIAANAFESCTQIVTVSVPESVTSIGASAFAGCTGLELVCLPSTLTQLATDAFSDCTALKAIACNATSAPNTSLALSASNVALYAPSGTASAYSNWGSVAEAGASYLIADGILGATGTNDATVLKAASTVSGTFTAGAEVTAIASGAFENCTALTGVDLSACAELSSIGTGAFQGCTALASVNLGSTITAIPDDCFNGCAALASISAPGTLESVGNRAFKQCASLPSLGFLQKTALTTIGDEAFYGCTVLRYGSSSATYLPSTVSSIGASAFENCANIKNVVLPASLTTLRESTFANCSSLQTVKLTAPIYSIGKYCFANCAVLNDVALRSTTASGTTSYAAESSLSIIGVGAFENCSALSGMDLSGAESLAVLGARAFENCSTLSSIRFASGITELQSNCFAGCSSLVDINLPAATPPSIGATIFGTGSLNTDNTTAYVSESARSAYLSAWIEQLDGDYGEGTTEELLQASADGSFTLSGVTYELNDDGSYTLVKASKKLSGAYTVMAGTTYIADRAFEGCTGLTSLSFPSNDPDTTVSFGDECFKGCTGLTKVTFNCNVPSMGESVFEGCTGLVSFTVSDGYTIERFGTRCFAECTALGSDAVSIAGVVKIIGEECFAGCTSLTAFAASDNYRQGITAVEDRAFINCTALSTFPIGSSKSSEYAALNTLGVEVFKGCTSLANIYIPAGFTGTLPEGMFQDCTGLQTCSFISEVDTIGKNCFKGCTSLIKTGGDSTARNALTTIEEGAYEGCTNLTTDVSTDSYTSSVNWGLSRYPNLSSIGDRAFYGCSANFTEAVFANEDFAYIGTDAFAGCSNLATMSFAGTTLPAIKNLNLSDYASDFTITSSAYSEDESAAETNATIYSNYLSALTELVGSTQAEAILAKPATMTSGDTGDTTEDGSSEPNGVSIASVEEEATVPESETSRTGETTEQGSTNNAAAGTEGGSGSDGEADTSTSTTAGSGDASASNSGDTASSVGNNTGSSDNSDSSATNDAGNNANSSSGSTGDNAAGETNSTSANTADEDSNTTQQ